MHSELLFGPGQINEPYNAPILGSSIHVEFGNFSTAFESTVSISSKCSARIIFSGHPDGYRICKHKDIPTDVDFILPKSGTITLRGTAHIPASHPALLEAHAAVGRILQMTAMAEYIDNVLRDQE